MSDLPRFSVTSSLPAVLAVDGGGTKTAAIRVGQDGSIQDFRVTGGSNPFDQPAWRDVLAELVTPMRSGIQASAFGLAGYGENRAMGQHIQTHLQSLCPNAPLSISNDVDMACAGAFAGGAGVLLLSGTGSIAWAQNAEGHSQRVGGWGSVFGDEGSAYWLGRMALEHLCQALDGRRPEATEFAQRLCTHMDWPTTNPEAMDALLGWHAGQKHPRSAVAQCARLVDSMAEEGCQHARFLLTQAATELARSIQTARAFFPTETLPWSYAGSVFNSRSVLTDLTAVCGAPQAPVLPPLGGGILRAARSAGWAVTTDWIATLAQQFALLASPSSTQGPA
ncbi:MAG: N-acetylglucosamine kinase [Acetobacter sp.]|uniref:N-acetylglucosamine kinase n=1 Tax=Acetobacter sp. TaxID=440 RepID=UPI003F8FA653